MPLACGFVNLLIIPYLFYKFFVSFNVFLILFKEVMQGFACEIGMENYNDI